MVAKTVAQLRREHPEITLSYVARMIRNQRLFSRAQRRMAIECPQLLFIVGVRHALSKAKRPKVGARDSFTCRYCHAQLCPETFTVDHVVAVSKGGSDDPSNLVTAYVDCNLAKGDMDLEQWLEAIAA